MKKLTKRASLLVEILRKAPDHKLHSFTCSRMLGTNYSPRAADEARDSGFNIESIQGVPSPYGGKSHGCLYILHENKTVNVNTDPQKYAQITQKIYFKPTTIPNGYIFVGSEIVKIEKPTQEQLI